MELKENSERNYRIAKGMRSSHPHIRQLIELESKTQAYEECKEIFEKMIDEIDEELRKNVIYIDYENVNYCVKDVKVFHNFLMELKSKLK